MDLEALWQEHKQFVIKVAAGALVLLIGNGWASSVQGEADRLVRTNVTAQGDLVSMMESLQGAEGRERGRSEALEQRLAPAIQEAILWKPDPAFALPAGSKNPGIFYAGAASKAAGKVDEAAGSFHADVPRDASGLGFPGNVDEGKVVEVLAQVDVTERLVRMLIHAGVRRVSTVQPGDVRYGPLGEQKKAGEEGDGKPERHLRLIPVKVVFTGSALDLAKVLGEVQTPGSFMEVVECQVQRESDKPGAAVEIALELQAITIVDQLPASAKVEEASARPTRRTRRTFTRER